MTIELPINVARFIEPIVLDAPRFFRMWSSVQTPPESVEEVFRASAVINMPNIQKLLSIGCRLAILSVRCLFQPKAITHPFKRCSHHYLIVGSGK
jgi:hypothetical protein